MRWVVHRHGEITGRLIFENINLATFSVVGSCRVWVVLFRGSKCGCRTGNTRGGCCGRLTGDGRSAGFVEGGFDFLFRDRGGVCGFTREREIAVDQILENVNVGGRG